MTYIDFICNKLKNIKSGTPIYVNRIAEAMAKHYGITKKEAVYAASVAFKRILDSGAIPNLRRYQKGIYYLANKTPFGETKINKEQLILDKYILPDIGYETGFNALYKMGLTTQIPSVRQIATNMAKECIRTDKKLGIVIKPPKTEITKENKKYLQILDILDLLDKAPIDEEQPYLIIANYIKEKNLEYSNLLAFADRYYNKNTIMQLAHTANIGGL